MSPIFGRYDIKEQLALGGMATVFLAHDPYFERDVALKVLPREFLHDSTFQQRFQREAKLIAALEHSAIVPVYDFGVQDDQPFLVMRYMRGGSLKTRLAHGPLGLDEIMRIVDRVASALDRAHSRGIIHRDVKPGNILFDEDGDAYLGDFGIARLSDATSVLTGTMPIGTPAYMAPELVDAGGLSSLVDVYALGIITYLMLAGEHPFEADTPSGFVMAHLGKPVPDIREKRGDLPEVIQRVIAGGMAKKPVQRYQSAGELAADLRAALTGGMIKGGPETDPTDTRSATLIKPHDDAVSQTFIEDPAGVSPHLMEDAPTAAMDAPFVSQPDTYIETAGAGSPQDYVVESAIPAAPAARRSPRKKRGGLSLVLVIAVVGLALLLGGLLAVVASRPLGLFGGGTDMGEFSPDDRDKSSKDTVVTEVPAVPTLVPTEAPSPTPEPITLDDLLPDHDLSSEVRYVDELPEGFIYESDAGLFEVDQSLAEMFLARQEQLASDIGIKSEETLYGYTNFSDDLVNDQVFFTSSARGIDWPVATEGGNRDPAWSPSGELIAYLHMELTDDGWLGTQIYIRSLIDGLTYRLLGEYEAATLNGISWSPDGRMLALHDRDWGGLTIIDIASGRLQRVIDKPAEDISWSPDGERIAFWAREGSGPNDADGWVLYIVDIDGGNLTLVSDHDDSRGEFGDFLWVPNGSLLTYTTFELFGEERGPYLVRQFSVRFSAVAPLDDTILVVKQTFFPWFVYRDVDEWTVWPDQ